MKKKWRVLFVVFVLAMGIGFAQPADAANVKLEVDGQAIQLDQPPVITNDRVLVPMRALAEALDADVTWNNTTRQMISMRGGDTLILTIDDHTMWRNDDAITLDVAPTIFNGRTLAPVRAISEGFDAEVYWDYAAQTVRILTDQSENYARDVFDLTNQERLKAGLKPFAWSDALAEVAAAHSRDMSERQFFSHTNPDGLSPFDRMNAAGIHYGWAAENIAMRYPSPEAVVEGWMNSPGHRANILNEHLTTLGVGYYKGYWTQCFTD